MEKNIKKNTTRDNLNCPRNLETILYGIRTLFVSKSKIDGMNNRAIEKVRNGGNLVILLHGSCPNLAWMYYPMRLLEKFGVDVVSIDYNYKKSVNNSSLYIKNKIDNLMKQTGAKKFSLIGICLGGIVARYYMEKFDRGNRVDKLVTIYSPLKSLPDNSVGYNVSNLMGGDPMAYNRALEEIEGINSIKNHLFIYSSTDKIMKPKYTTDENFNQICLRGGHLLVSYNANVLKIAADYIKNPAPAL